MIKSSCEASVALYFDGNKRTGSEECEFSIANEGRDQKAFFFVRNEQGSLTMFLGRDEVDALIEALNVIKMSMENTTR